MRTILFTATVAILALHSASVTADNTCNVTSTPPQTPDNGFGNDYCSGYHTELDATQKFCTIVDSVHTQNNAAYNATDGTAQQFSCTYGINVDYFQLNYYDSNGGDSWIDTTFTLSDGTNPYGQMPVVDANTCFDWTEYFINNGVTGTPTYVSWSWTAQKNNAGVNVVDGIWYAYAMWCAPAPTIPPVTTTTPTTTPPTTTAPTVVSTGTLVPTVLATTTATVKANNTVHAATGTASRTTVAIAAGVSLAAIVLVV